MIELSIQNLIREKLLASNRSLALSALPGMGLTTILSRIPLELDSRFVLVSGEQLPRISKEIIKARKDVRFTIHIAVIRALINSLPDLSIPKKDSKQTNLVSFLKSTKWPETNIIIDDFDCLPDELAVTILDEIKSFDDNKAFESYKSLKAVRFIIGGFLDFNSLYFGTLRRGVSPATNFDKVFPNEFVLSDNDVYALLNNSFPDVAIDKGLAQLTLEWSNGYLHYIVELAKWIQRNKDRNHDISISNILVKMKQAIAEREPLEIFKYLSFGWDQVCENRELLKLLIIAMGSGYVSCPCYKARQLISLGMLLPIDPNREEYHIPNKLVELYLRQRLAESGLVMSAIDGSMWSVKMLNSRAYAVLMGIEQQLRSYIGDKFLYEFDGESIDQVLGDLRDNSTVDKIVSVADFRRTEDLESPFNEGGNHDSILHFMDFNDLGVLIRIRPDLFPKRLVNNLPLFVQRLNYLRRRIAHNRAITNSQLESVEFEWDKMQRLLSFED